ncbi:putative metal-binding motif-containing protein [Myxococcota bacterium]|nr:putative metal-binding motif-containing protein [Myxococcota bacterium]
MRRTTLAVLVMWAAVWGCDQDRGRAEDLADDDQVEADDDTPDDDGPDADGDGFADDVDCDDGAGVVHPGADDVCGDVDSDCDGQPDPGDLDLDQDHVTPCGGDCDDGDPDVHPWADEICDGLDQDCDDQADEDLHFVTYYRDRDEDGYGDDADTASSCDGPPSGYSSDDGDCDDHDDDIHPGAFACDGLDTDCDGLPDADELDDDGDGITECGGDCRDDEPDVYPGQEEWFTTSLWDWTWDYDCSGTNEMEYPELYGGGATCGWLGDIIAECGEARVLYCEDGYGGSTTYYSKLQGCH